MKTLYSLAALAVPLFVFFGCSSKSDESSKEQDAELQAKVEILKAEVEDYYRTKVALPIEVQDQLENGEVTQEEIDQRAAAGEFPNFFQFKSLEDLPADLAWEDGSDLPEIGSPKATKGGTSYGTIQDFLERSGQLDRTAMAHSGRFSWTMLRC